MQKNNTIFTCSKCDAQFPKWAGRCSSCGAWGTIAEEIQNSKLQVQSQKIKFDEKKLIDFENISTEKFVRIKTNIGEIDNLLGGGIVQGSFILIGGEPGIGKSTLVLQILKQLATTAPLLYISGEESAEQIKIRVDRLNYQPKNLKFLSETNVEEIVAAINALKPGVAIIDSIQTIYSSDVEGEAGNISQIRACTVKLLETAKTLNIPIIITGHVTKDGSVAGPKTLEHLVDVVIYIEGDKTHGFRLIRSSKNRFGSTNEIGVFEMTGEGLIEVKDPSRIFLQNNSHNNSGSVISCFMEGSRPFLIEVQALVTPTVFGYPVRKAAGYDLNRLQMISAVLMKRARLNLANQDIHLNITGGFKIKEPAIDLAVALAIYSALKDKVIPKDTAVVGELGLSGEIRSVPNLERRIIEAEKLGFKNIAIPDSKINGQFKINLQKIKDITELLK